MTLRPIPSLFRDKSGATVIEFAVVMPVMLMLIMGTMEFGLNIYVRSVLEGVMQQAGRNTSLESGAANLSAIHTMVENRIKAIIPNATVTPTRKNFSSFITASKPEERYDSNGDGTIDANDCFYDLNDNGVFDDGSRPSIGSASDVVKYTETVQYPALIPAARYFGISPTTSISATTILKNQPYNTASTWTTRSVCP